MPPTVEMNLELDVARQLATIIRSWGYTCADDEPFDDIGCRFQMLLARVPQPASRKLELAKGFVCPPDKQRGLWEFRVRSSAGISLRPFLSRSSKKPDYQDGMLIDWGILHFHISDEFENDGYVKRSGDILFAMVVESAIYCIGFWPHNSWSKQEVIGIIHDNWPTLIENYRLNNIVGLSSSVTDDDIEKLRAANINSAFEPRPGVFYFGPGGGQVASGHSATAMRKTMYLRRVLQHLDKKAREQLENADQGRSYTLTGHMEEDRVSVKDESGNVIVWHRI